MALGEKWEDFGTFARNALTPCPAIAYERTTKLRRSRNKKVKIRCKGQRAALRVGHIVLLCFCM